MKNISKIIAAVLSVGALTTINATEGGGGSYPLGIESEVGGINPPPGLYYINYASEYRADKVTNGNGDTVNSNLGLKATSNTFRFLWMTGKKLWGGDFALTGALPLVNVEATGVPSSAGNKSSGLGDIALVPFAVSWPSNVYFQKVGLEFTLPTGTYDKSKAINVGRNVVTTTLFYGGTYFYNDWQAAGFFKYDMNQENDATHIKSGDEFHVDYSIGKYFGKQVNPIAKEWLVNLGGYYYQQVTGDSGSGNTKGDNKGKVIAIGPEVSYSHDNMIFTFKHHIEIESENRAQGSNSLFKFIYTF